MAFSTKDQDNDLANSKGYCAQQWKGGWWFKACHYAFLNGFYYKGSHSNSRTGGVVWYYWKGLISLMARPTLASVVSIPGKWTMFALLIHWHCYIRICPLRGYGIRNCAYLGMCICQVV